jgi:hypothetical protein
MCTKMPPEFLALFLEAGYQFEPQDLNEIVLMSPWPLKVIQLLRDAGYLLSNLTFESILSRVELTSEVFDLFRSMEMRLTCQDAINYLMTKPHLKSPEEAHAVVRRFKLAKIFPM